MTLRSRLLAMFVAIIVLVAVTMGIYNFQLLEVFFRQAASAELRTVGPGVQRLMEQSASLLTTGIGARAVADYISGTTQSRVLFTDSSGAIILDTAPSAQSLVGQVIPPSTLIGSTLRQGTTQTFSYTAAGPDALAVSVPWVNAGRIVGAVLLIRQVQTAARQTALEVSHYVFRAGLLAAAVAMVAAFFMSSSITGPLRKMSHAARSISKGNFSERLEIPVEDELGDLAEAMNSMSGEISTLISNLTEEKEKLQALMDERTNMMSDISHDLRTPITSIRGFVEALRDGVITDEAEKARTLNIIHEESERLSRLVNDLFYLARLEAGESPAEMAEVDLAAVLRGTVETMMPISKEKELSVAVDINEDAALKGLFRVTGSADRLTRAILNILDNAVKYSPHGGSIGVSLALKEMSDSQQPGSGTAAPSKDALPPARTTGSDVSSRREDALAPVKPIGNGTSSRQAVISISDQGPGISEDDIARIFERFYRADKARSRSKSGAGLGLSIARFIVEQHKGTMSVDSELGKGSTFHISLPLL